jgi:hypothetical protein
VTGQKEQGSFSASCRCNGHEATARLSNQQAGRPVLSRISAETAGATAKRLAQRGGYSYERKNGEELPGTGVHSTLVSPGSSFLFSLDSMGLDRGVQVGRRFHSIQRGISSSLIEGAAARRR